MTPDQRFGLIMFVLGLIVALVGFFGRRIIKRNDERWDLLDTLAKTSQLNEAEKPEWIKRMDRSDLAQAKLLEIVTEMGLQQARHEGYHERMHEHVPNETMG